MDLLTYAVNRKLTYSEDPLLGYVARREDVPVNVLEGSFAELLKPLSDEQSTLLVEDYPKMLEKYVPVQYTGNQPDGSYKVSGEISENLLEAINLVHGKKQEEVISEMISESTRQITNRPVSVGDLSLKELTLQMQGLTDNMSDVQNFDTEGLEMYQEDENQKEEFSPEDLAEEMTQNLAEEVIEGVVTEEILEDAPYEEESYEEEIYEEDFESEEEAYEDEIPEEETYEDEIPEEETDAGEEMSEEEAEIAESRMLAEGIKRVYSRLVEDLKAYGLDKSLGLSL